MKTAKQKLDSGETMAEMWEGFASFTMTGIPRTSIQYIEMEKAFYSGALCLFQWFMVQMDEDREPTEADLQRVDRIKAEIDAFMVQAITARGTG